MAARPAGGADGGQTPAARRGGSGLCAAVERGRLEDSGDDEGNRVGFLRLLRRCCPGCGRWKGWGAAGIYALLAGTGQGGGAKLLGGWGALSGFREMGFRSHWGSC